MNYFGIDHLIVYAFLIITLIIGIRAGKGIKNMREYVLANKSFGTLTLLLTFLATEIGCGAVIGATNEIFSKGIIRTATTIGLFIPLLFIAFFIAPRMNRFSGCLTAGDVMQKQYGTLAQIVTGILSMFYSAAMIGLQFYATGIIAKDLLGVDARWGIIIVGSILTLYAAHGGIKSVTITDVFQFIILVVVLPLIATIALKNAGGIKMVLTHIPDNKLQIWNNKDFYFYLSGAISYILPSILTNPAIFQRLLMARSTNELREQYLLAAGFDFMFRILLMLIGLSAIILYPSLTGKSILPHMIQELIPIGAKGIAIAGLFAIAMSTADSFLHTGGILLSHDVLSPIYKKRGMALNELKWSRYSTLIIGIASIIIALKGGTANFSLVSVWSRKFTAPLLMFPLVATLFGLQSNKKTLYLASIGTIVTLFATDWLLPRTYAPLSAPISILINGILFFGIHWIRNKQFIFSHMTQEPLTP
jgi:Na+/proline symporter